jgi:hypothetical protein
MVYQLIPSTVRENAPRTMLGYFRASHSGLRSAGALSFAGLEDKESAVLRPRESGTSIPSTVRERRPPVLGYFRTSHSGLQRERGLRCGCYWQRGDDRVGEFGCGGATAEVAGGVLAFAVDALEGGFDAAGGGALAEMIEHHDAAH